MLPNEPDLQARLLAAVGDMPEPAEHGKVALEFETNEATGSTVPPKIGRYQIQKRLDSGGMGVLYLAVDPALDRPVAVKLLRFSVDELHERFTREARAVARLHHRNVVTVFDVGEHEGHPFIAMEYVAGETLEELIHRRAGFSIPQKARLIADLCDGLASAHKAGVIHRDVKPANVMVAHDGALKIIDFGIARLAGSDMTQTGAFIGTPSYMSPEQIEGRPADEFSDIFCVGLVAYELFSSRRAFPGDAQHVVTTNILSAQPQPLTEFVPDLDHELVQIVMRALRKQPRERYPNLGTMSRDLTRVATRLESTSIQQDGHLPTRRRQSVAAISIGAIIVLITALAVTWSQNPTTSTFLPSVTRDLESTSASPTAEPVGSLQVVPDAVGVETQPAVVGSLPLPTPADEFDQKRMADAIAGSGVQGPPPSSRATSSSPPRDRRETTSAGLAALIEEAETLRRQREYEPAVALYLEILTRAPQDEKARAGLRDTLASKLRADEALERLAGPSQGSNSRRPSAETESERLVSVALNAMNAGDDTTAQTALQDALKVDPRNESAQKLLKVLTGR
jgi:serine/threonine protein kinase